jgi:3'-phosphoadenosine 5'-phosphosulfate (PAPS) 3'-phosphatase
VTAAPIKATPTSNTTSIRDSLKPCDIKSAKRDIFERFGKTYQDASEQRASEKKDFARVLKGFY